MSIEFTCLHCGNRMLTSDDQTGERVACSKCREMITVPVPIGGRLTERRLSVDSPGSVKQPWAPPKPEQPVNQPLAEEESSFADLPADPGMGFNTDVRLPKLLRRNERPAIEETARLILGDIVTHMENAPHDFQSAGLVLEVDRFEVDPERINARLGLFGSVNGERFTAAAQKFFDRTQYRRSLLVIVTELIVKTLFSGTQIRAAHRTIRKVVRRQLCDALDEAAGHPLTIWRRLGRFITRPMG